MNVNEKLISCFQQVYDDCQFIVTYKEPNLEIIYSNKHMRDFAGFTSADAVLGKTDYDFRWCMFADLYAKHEKDALNKNIYAAMYPSCDFKGNDVIVSCHRTPYFDENKNIVGVLTHTHIIRDSKALELSNLLHHSEPDIGYKSYTFKRNFNKEIMTTRERECLFYFIRGKSSKVIARLLGLSHRTVEKHIENCKTKFGCHSTSELIDSAIAAGYLYDLPLSLLKKLRTTLALK